MFSDVSFIVLPYIILKNILIVPSFVETSPGGYDFDARVWKTKDGCYNIDFDDAFGGAGHGWCCGQLPCDIVTKG
jgi:hypothetical protein